MPSDLIRGKYQIIREIARSNDIVFEALDTTLGRRIAIKELNLAPGMTGEARRERIERFHREARATGRLNHPNIVAVSDYFEENGRYFIVMEFLEGQTLRDTMSVRGAMPLNESIQIASQILDALAYAHSNRLVHRDIKPDNIFILPGGIAKLADFGIARLSEEPALTSNGQVFGTPSYMSPEQIEGKPVDQRSDLFSMGVLLFEMLMGRKPFLGDSVISITYAIMNAEPAGMHGIPNSVEQVVRRSLAKNPLARQSNAEQMKLDLRNAELNPAIFSNPTGMNRTGSGVASGMPAAMQSSSMPGYSPFPQASQSGYSVQQSQMPQTSQTPPNQSQPAGLPWAWGGTAQNPGVPAVPGLPPINGLPPAAGGGVALPPGYRQPQPSEPLFALSPGAKTLLATLGLAVVIGTLVAFGAIAVQNNFSKFDEQTRREQILLHNKTGVDFALKGKFHEAINEYDVALTFNPTPPDRNEIRKNRSKAYVSLAEEEWRNKNALAAKNDYLKAIEDFPDYPAARNGLANLLRQEGDISGAKAQEEASAGAEAVSSTPQQDLPSLHQPIASGPYVDPDAALRRNQQQAKQLVEEGDALYKNGQGDPDGATAKWEKALELSAGTPLHQQIMDKLESLRNRSNTGSESGSGQ